MHWTEMVAKQVVELGRDVRLTYRTDQSAGEADFLYAEDGVPCGVLEVTRATDIDYKCDFAAVDKAQFIEARLSNGDWRVTPRPGAKVARIRREVDRYLAKIEGERIEEFFAPIDAGSSAAVEAIWRDLGIQGGSRLKWKKPRQICIAYPVGDPVILKRSDLNRIVEREAAKADNRTKLRGHGDVRSLVVVVDSIEHGAWTALVHRGLPGEGPRLPEEITDVWAIAATRDRAWVARASRGDLWRAVEQIPVPEHLWE